MALKDWKQIGNSKVSTTWINIRKQWDTTDEPMVDVRLVSRESKDYGLQIYGEHHRNSYQRYDSKTKAMREAIKYMRSH